MFEVILQTKFYLQSSEILSTNLDKSGIKVWLWASSSIVMLAKYTEATRIVMYCGVNRADLDMLVFLGNCSSHLPRNSYSSQLTYLVSLKYYLAFHVPKKVLLLLQFYIEISKK